MHGRIHPGVWPGHTLRSGHPGTRCPHSRPRSRTPHPVPRCSGPRCSRAPHSASSWAAGTSAGREGRRWHATRPGHGTGNAELLSLGPGGDDGGHGSRRAAGDRRHSSGRSHKTGGDTRLHARLHASRGYATRWNHARRNTVGRRKATRGRNTSWRHHTARPWGHSGCHT